MSAALDRVERAKAELERFKRETLLADTLGVRACGDCRHFDRWEYVCHDDRDCGEGDGYGVCRHPAIQNVEPDFRRGGISVSGEKYYRDMRADDGLCGPEGALHDPEEVRPSFFERLFGK